MRRRARYTQFPQQGTLVIEDDVEIGANSTIDRGALGETRVRRGAKFDNLVHVGHNCDIGEDAILVALTGISGSSTIGKGAVLAGQVGIGDHVTCGSGRDSWRAGRGLQRRDGDERWTEAGDGALGHASAAAERSAEGAGDAGAIGEEAEESCWPLAISSGAVEPAVLAPAKKELRAKS